MTPELRRLFEAIETELIVAIDGLHMVRRRLHEVLRGEPPEPPSGAARRSPG